jgi:RNA polymerase sigma factor (sigma-70 family)
LSSPLNNISQLDDKQLLIEYRSSLNKEIVAVLFKRYTHLILGICMKYLRDKDDAEDAVMQVFEKLLLDLHKHEVVEFKFWLHTVVKNHCLSHLRKQQTQQKNHHMLEKDSISIMESDISMHHVNGKEKELLQMEDAMLKLNEAQRVCVDLFYLKEKSYKEVSDITGYSMNDVKSYIQNGKRNLKIMMSQSNE